MVPVIFAALFGVKQYGVHINGYLNHSKKGWCMWIAKRAKTKQTWPGKLDQMVGQQMHGTDVERIGKILCLGLICPIFYLELNCTQIDLWALAKILQLSMLIIILFSFLVCRRAIQWSGYLGVCS